ncbi:helix-turn-helix domain-containing protein [Nocardioides jensenii]|uniref:transcriptional regulator n=1 Tax=Nocardioides jensenii TaxID=1843 RepID=UPI0008299C28|nr:transcriptional regulator [Nocardioides jensenii]
MTITTSTQVTASCCDPEEKHKYVDFLRAVFTVTDGREPSGVATIAVRVGTTNAAAEDTVRALYEHGLVRVDGDGWLTLTEHGMEHARAAVGHRGVPRARS